MRIHILVLMKNENKSFYNKTFLKTSSQSLYQKKTSNKIYYVIYNLIYLSHSIFLIQKSLFL